MTPDPLFYGVAGLVVILVGISKSGLGGGLGVLAVPLLSLVSEPLFAAALLLPLLLIMDLLALWQYRGQWDGALLKQLIPPAVLGIGIGALSFSLMTNDHLRVLLGLLAVTFALNHWFLQPSQQQAPNQCKASFSGGLAGYTSFAVHAGGPPLNFYLLPLRLPPTRYVGTTVVFFATVNYIKVVPYVWLGQLNWETLKIALFLFPLTPIGLILGQKLLIKLPKILFYQLVYGLLLITGLKLLWEGSHALWLSGA